MTANPQRFAFETVFDATGRVVAGPQRRDPEREAQIAKARAEGHAAGRAEAMEQIERAAADAARALASQAQLLLSRLEAECEALRAEAVELALAAARVAAGRALDAAPEGLVMEVVGEAARSLRTAPRLVCRLAPDLAERLADRIAQEAEAGGFPGKVLVLADPAARAGDIRLEWDDGVIARDRADVFARIDAVADRYLAGDLPAAPKDSEPHA
jgi:flagellar assembly protein FliH